ncbi:MAG: hypothetical protein QM758_24375 [Armatimonas sp.]
MKANLTLLALLCLLTNASAQPDPGAVYHIRYSTPNELISKWSAGNSALKDKIKLDIDEKNNSLLISGEKGDISTAINEIKNLDVLPKSFTIKLQIVKVEKGKKDAIIQSPVISTIDNLKGKISQLSQDGTEGWILEATPKSVNSELVSVSIKMQKVGNPTLSTEVVRQVIPGQKTRVTGFTTDTDPKIHEQVILGKPVTMKNKSVFYYLDITVEESKG